MDSEPIHPQHGPNLPFEPASGTETGATQESWETTLKIPRVIIERSSSEIT